MPWADRSEISEGMMEFLEADFDKDEIQPVPNSSQQKKILCAVLGT